MNMFFLILYNTFKSDIYVSENFLLWHVEINEINTMKFRRFRINHEIQNEILPDYCGIKYKKAKE